ncbi:right-handed parallel beta-helix repeat-containing protein [uncultured Methanobrevibacter sp.]|uniref:right-handed parallel beta-helix repeat-containing protein n=1 Tax=uncultured Methanobrevibacter sp. TaxID=253161 RepID=UPI0026E054F4|nr:right-handed parallel beta-helix repeat-containing protein [uncultured Methanobrevibacter sp.]
MKKNIKFLAILLFFIIMAMGAVSAENSTAIDDSSIISQSSEYSVTDANYGDYFDDNDNLKDNVVDGDTLTLSGDFNNKNFRINKNITLTGNGATIYNGTITLDNGSSGSTVSNLKIINLNIAKTSGIVLKDVTNCYIINNYVTCSGQNSITITLTGSSHNVVSDNICISAYYLVGKTNKSNSGILIEKSSDYNLIANNYVEMGNANGIYFVKSNNNTVRGNTVNCTADKTDFFCVGIQSTGTDNIYESNRITKTTIGIGAGANANVNNNIISNVTQSGINAGANSNVNGNTITNCTLKDSAISVSGANSTISGNNIDVKGASKGISANNNDIKVFDNNIKTETGACIYQSSKRSGLLVSNNNLTSVSGVGVLAQKSTDMIINNNNISTSNQYAIDVSAATDNNYDIKNNHVSGSSLMNTADGAKNPNIFTVDVNNYDNYFDEDGNLKDNVENGYTLILTGDFNEKSFIINKNITLTGEGATIYKGVVALIRGASGSTISNLKIINLECTDKQGIILNEVTNCLIKNNNITCSGQSSFPIALNPGANYNVISDNIIKSGGISLEGSTKSTSGLVLGNAHYNLIKNNYIVVDDANGIYLSAYGSGSFIGGNSNHNVIRNNTVKCNLPDPTSWCYGIQLMGANNTAEFNTVIGTFRGISTGADSNVTNNTLINITGKNFSTGEMVGGDYAIIVGANSIVSDNKLINCFVESAAVYVGTDSTVKNNDINIKGKGVGVDANGNNVKVINNNITTDSGNGVSQIGKLTGLVVSNNNITSTSGVGVYVGKASKTKVPSDITITDNTISTSNQYAINAKDANKDSYTIKNNKVNGSSTIYTPDGEVLPDDPSQFEGKVHNITSDNYHVFFDDNGNLINTDVNEGDILNFKGEFSEIFPIISKSVKVTGDNAVLKNSKITVSSDNVWIENLKIINDNSSHINHWGIYADDLENITIVNNNISVWDKNAAYAIYLHNVFNATVKDNILYSSGDYLTYTLLGVGVEGSTIENNRILTNGTGQHHNYEANKCIDGVNSFNEIYRTYGILLITSSGNQIKSNDVTVTSKLDKTVLNYNGALCTNSLVGIDAYFDSSDNVFDENTILIYGYDNYMYGMGVLGAETNSGSEEKATNNNFTNNDVTVRGNHMGTGLISGYHSENTLIKGNTFDIVGNSSAYGVTLEYAKNSKVIDNKISLKSNVSYAVEIFDGNGNVIDGNNMTTNGAYGFGVAGYGSNNNKITNNDIRVNSAGYAQIPITNHPDALGYGNAGVFFKASSTGNNISNNRIVSTKGYAVNLTGVSGNTVSNNYLKGETKKGNAAVLGSENNVVADNAGNEPLSGIITNSTFFDYFYENGMLLPEVTNKTLIFVGEFSHLGVSVITITDPIRLVSNNAVLNDMAISIAGNNVVVDGFTFVSTLENVIEVYGNNVSIINNKFNSDLVQNKYNVLIYATEVADLTIKNNTITFKGTNTGSINGVIKLEDVNNTLISDNKIDAEIPSAATSYGPGPDYAAIYSSYLIQVKGNNNKILNNDLSLRYSSVLGSYDSLYAIIVSGSNSVVSKNSIKGTGNNYIYGIVASGSNVNLTDNTIIIFNSSYYANGISLNSPYSGVISNNIINLTAKSVVYGTNDYGIISALYKGNKFILNSNSVYGMELMGTDEKAIGNTIIAKGNYTLGIAASTNGKVNISNNDISINGAGLGTPTAGDTITSANIGIYLAGSPSEAIVSGNKITAILPSCSWDKDSAALVSNVEGALIDSNKMDVSVSNAVGSYDSIYGAKISGDNVKFTNNALTLKGVNYAYGLKASGENVKIDSNNITVINDVNHGVGIEVDCPFKGTVNNNIVDVNCKDAAYGIYSSQWGSDVVEGNYTNNKVTVNGKTSYGFELAGEKEIVSNNDIVADGQYTMGIATKTKEITIADNRIRSNGAGKTNATTADMFGATNEGILIYDGNVKGTILRNNVTTTGKYAVNVLKSKNSASTVKENYLIAAALLGDMAVNNVTGVVANNTPDKFASSEDVVKYFKNGTQYYVKVVDAQGNPVSGEKIVVELNGKSFKNLRYTIVTDANGIATLVINLAVGSYTITAYYNGQVLRNTITVLSMSYNLAAEDINMGFKDGTQYAVKLVDGKGNPVSGEKVSVIINSPKWAKPATYNIVTDSNGIARLPIGLAVGQYTFTAKYDKEAVTTKVNVLSQPYVVAVSDVVKYFKNGTQYTVTVKDLKGNVVAGKTVVVTLSSPNWSKPSTYNIVTNSNGVATLVIGLSPGQYTAKAAVGDNVAVSSIRVLPTLTSESLTKPANQPGNLVAKLVDGQGKAMSGKAITFTIKAKTYTKITDVNGLAALPIGLGVGTWTINIADPSTGAKTTAKVIITKARA